MMLAYLFPGQGSQARGMGRELFDQFPQLTAQADDILGYSVRELCLDDNGTQLNQTQYTQPALYTVNALAYLQKLQDDVIKPSFLAGHSLGEYNALLAAEVFDFATGLQMVKKRGELMGQASGGSMAAIVGLPIDAVRVFIEQHFQQSIAIANHNSHAQVVISGGEENIQKAQTLLKQSQNAMVIPLAVSGAFHSPFMQEAQDQYEQFLVGFEFSSPTIPVIANITARPYQNNSVRHNLTNHITSTVRWTESIDYLIHQGISVFEEVGPGKILTGLVRRIKNKQ